MSKILGTRTDCVTGEKRQVELECVITCGKLGNIFQLIGGPTGYESFYIDQGTMERMKKYGWTACMGDVGYNFPVYDKLEISAEEMTKAFKELDVLKEGEIVG